MSDGICIPFSEATEDFAAVTKMAAQNGHVVIEKDGRKKFIVIDLDVEPQIEMSEDEKLEFVASRILKEHIAAFEELAK